MKKLLLTTITLIIHTFTFGQQWLYFSPAASGDYINIFDLDVSGSAMTLEALVSAQDTSQLNGLNILSKHTAPADVNYILRPNRFEFTTSAGYILAENPVQLCLDSVYHLAGTYDGATVKFYVNGVVVASVPHSGTLVNNNFLAAIGNRSWPNDEQFRGYLDEVRIWNVARTQAQIAANMYDLPNPIIEPGLLAYYKFDGSFMNAQGNSAWNGGAIGAQSSFMANPFFNGSISTDFCASSTGISEVHNSALIGISPNPSNGHFILELPGFLKGKSDMKIFDSLGQTIFHSGIDPLIKQVNIEVPDGIYFVMLSDEKQSYFGKVIIQH